MQIISIEMLVLLFLFIISLADLKWKAIPSIVMTGMLFVVAVVNTSNFFYFGLLTIFGLLMYEFDFISGIADLKAFAIIGFVISSHYEVFIFMMLFVVFGFFYKVLSKYMLKEKYEIAFLPVFFFSYMGLKIVMSIVFGGIWV